ncbi:cytochrome b/b6 domain-containing protein [Halomicronema sp. CCY15110]|uniref:cytochrome b/b6 domain-containing protein n=1 Tax=Halomicronema sp. CCY15110 TaxID=2767773 RepID=UPI00194E9F06|nr:cytochrome b/b6 domain-containing protein [Halomicronema sp. CCY15110]
MTPSRPYQPLLLRVLHGLTGLCLMAAMVTAYWTYEVYDGRWGGIPLPEYRAIEGLHGTFGLWTLLIFPALLIYACRQGRRRLWQPQSWQQLADVGKPIWWYTLNRLVNTLALLALTFALYSGKMMDETWLPRGELNHAWYYAHLISWVVMVGAIALHLLLNAKVGGTPLLLSMLTWQYREKDSPQRWPAHITQTWVAFRQGAWRHWLSTKTAIGVMEIAILGSLVVAWLLPLFK